MLKIKKIFQIKKNKLVTDSHIPLNIRFGEKYIEQECFEITNQKKSILDIRREIINNEITNIVLVGCEKVFFHNFNFDNENREIKIIEGIPQIYFNSNKIKAGFTTMIYNDFKVLYSFDKIKIVFTNVINNYDKIKKRRIRNHNIDFETNKNGTLLSITINELTYEIIKKIISILIKK
ncbi:hypothetical protein [Fusobacterium sp.]|uniref:hypothetical protein n=1 Tax=Fusobacterium sp. TaxID=68766 RepID=UPI0029031D4D|nr:hypothetical protein [Fusobacterium sp.]MDU1912484.1 hypothetical protein [Fusobacterium sp.]